MIIKKLIDYIKNIFHTIKKEDVLSSLENSMSSLSNEGIPALDMLIDDSELKILKDSKILKNMVYGSGIKAKDNKEFLIKMRVILMDIVKNDKKLEKLVIDGLNEVITDKTATVKDAAILRVVNDVSILATYLMDFYYILLIEASDKNTTYPKIKVKNVNEAIGSFSSMLKEYSIGFDKVITNISKLPDNLVNVDDTKVNMLMTVVNKFSRGTELPNISGFNYSPIYWARMRIVDIEIRRYEYLKDKKKLVELKLRELKLQEGGEENPKLRQSIEYYENKIAALEYEIVKFEDK